MISYSYKSDTSENVNPQGWGQDGSQEASPLFLFPRTSELFDVWLLLQGIKEHLDYLSREWQKRQRQDVWFRAQRGSSIKKISGRLPVSIIYQVTFFPVRPSVWGLPEAFVNFQRGVLALQSIWASLSNSSCRSNKLKRFLFFLFFPSAPLPVCLSFLLFPFNLLLWMRHGHGITGGFCHWRSVFLAPSLLLL